VSLRVGQGEIDALVGANGAGKSTFLNALAGLVPVASGRVVFRGAELQRLAPEQIVRRGLALTPEGRRVFPRLSVADNLRLGAVPMRDRAASERARKRVLTLFPILEERLHQVAGTLSGGEQQMLAIGRSLMAGPSLLLLDEPSLGLAPILVDEVFVLIERLREEGTTILLVEQNVHRALEVSDRAYVLANGAIEREGPAAELRSDAEIEKAYLGIGVS
jgi:branched-chain amino acid transport system ATP-binding protein